MVTDGRDRPQPATDRELSFVHLLSDGCEPTDELPTPWQPELVARVEEMQRVRDRGAAEGTNYWIGTGHA